MGSYSGAPEILKCVLDGIRKAVVALTSINQFTLSAAQPGWSYYWWRRRSTQRVVLWALCFASWRVLLIRRWDWCLRTEHCFLAQRAMLAQACSSVIYCSISKRCIVMASY